MSDASIRHVEPVHVEETALRILLRVPACSVQCPFRVTGAHKDLSKAVHILSGYTTDRTFSAFSGEE